MHPLQGTNKLLIISFAFFIVMGCGSESSPDKGYINYEKWNTVDGYQPSMVKAKPKEILDSSFSNLEDTLLSSEGSFDDYYLSRFDTSGNLVMRRIFIDSSRVYDHLSEFNENGKHSRQLSYRKFPADIEDSLIKRSVKVKANVFRTDFSERGSSYKKRSEITTFLPEKNAVRYEQSYDDKIASRTTYFYSNSLLVRTKKEFIGEDPDSDNEYYRSGEGILDSILISVDGRARSRELYFNNKQGDPVLIQTLDQGRLRSETRFKYEYDSKGNWIKRLGFTEGGDTPLMKEDSGKVKNHGYWLVKRYIKY